MKIKDFTPGQTVYAVGQKRGGTTEHFIERRTVVSVGRRYVRAAPEGSRLTDDFYLHNEADDFLTERYAFGERKKLFPTLEAANDGIERYMLRLWLRGAADWNKLDGYTLGQLREVKRILEGQEDG